MPILKAIGAEDQSGLARETSIGAGDMYKGTMGLVSCDQTESNQTLNGKGNFPVEKLVTRDYNGTIPTKRVAP